MYPNIDASFMSQNNRKLILTVKLANNFSTSHFSRKQTLGPILS